MSASGRWWSESATSTGWKVQIVRIAYADPPYPGQSAKHYGDHPDFAGEVDHAELIDRLYSEFDGFVLHTSAPAIAEVAQLLRDDVRWCAWVKPFAAFKANVPLAYAWEPVIVRPCRRQTVSNRITPLRDWLAEPITMQRGLSGSKPERVCWWLFEAVGAEPEDSFFDLFPGSGAVWRAWLDWSRGFALSDPRQETLL